MPALRTLDASDMNCELSLDDESKITLGQISRLGIPNLSFLNLCSDSSEIKSAKIGVRPGYFGHYVTDLNEVIAKAASLFPYLAELEIVSSLGVSYSRRMC